MPEEALSYDEMAKPLLGRIDVMPVEVTIKALRRQAAALAHKGLNRQAIELFRKAVQLLPEARSFHHI